MSRDLSPDLFLCIGFIGVCRVSFLPEELSRTNERLRMLKLPTLTRKKREKIKNLQNFLKMYKIFFENFYTKNIKINLKINFLINLNFAKICYIKSYHNIAPLIEFDWQVPVRLYPLRVRGIHHYDDERN